MAVCCAGVRVVRGPDWEWGDQDGGEGYVGTVVLVESSSHSPESSPDVAVVQWDAGERYTYRCGAQGKYDLRVLDSGAAGICHAHIKCSACGSESITGSIWRCLHCLRYHLCTPCYMLDRHSAWHHFNRIDSPDDFYKRTRVTCRRLSRWVAARGVFVGATVVRGSDWKWGNQDGGSGNTGKVVEIAGWHRESARSVAEVEWRESSRRRKYRMGHKGKVDLKCTVPAEFGHCYLDHLPVLGAPYEAPKSTFIAAGDKVLFVMDVEELKTQQLAIDAWDDVIGEFLGRIGLVNKVDLDEKTALVTFMRNAKFPIVTSALKKVEAPVHIHDDVVQVLDDIAEVHRLQQGHHGWEDDMALSLGLTGQVVLVHDDGDVVVWINGCRWTYNPACLLHAPGEEVEDCQVEVERPSHLDLLMVSILKEPNVEMLLHACARGHASVVKSMVEKWPSEVNTRHDGRTALHVAAAEGRPSVVQLLLEHNADIKAKDKDGEIALHCCAHFNHCEAAKILIEAGSDVNAKGETGLTPVHIAAALGYSRLLKLLLDNPSCKVDARNIIGHTPLQLACSSHWTSTAQLLVEAGSDVTLFDHRGMTAITAAVLRGFYPGLEILLNTHPEAINHLKIDDGFTPLHMAAVDDLFDEICCLAAVDTCEVDSKNYAHHTPLHIAVKEGYTRSIECLVGYGADVTIADLRGHTALHGVLGKKNMKPLSEWTVHLNKVHKEVRAAADNSIQSIPSYITVACFLVQEGASLHAASGEGLTPLDLCPSEFSSLLKLFSTPERRQHYTGSLPRHPPPVAPPLSPRPPQPITPQKLDHKANTTGAVATPTSTGTNQKGSVVGISEKNLDKGLRKDSSSSSSPHTPPLQHHNTAPKNSPVQTSCYLCEEPSDICFKPCGHIAMCDVCAKRVIRCPTCRNDVLEKIKIPTQ